MKWVHIAVLFRNLLPSRLAAKVPFQLLIQFLIGMGVAFGDHAAIISQSEALLLQRLFSSQNSVRHFCLPCGDTTWRTEKVREIRVEQARPEADEWAIYLNGTAIDAAYLYIPKNGRWVNVGFSAGLKFPDIPETLQGALKESQALEVDSSFAFFSWSGLYGLEDTIQLAKSQYPSSLQYSLQVFDFGDSLAAKLEVNGLNHSQRMSLKVIQRGDTLGFFLRRYLTGNFGKPFQVGDPLWELIRRPGGEIFTHWQTLNLKSESASENGFKRNHVDPRKNEE